MFLQLEHLGYLAVQAIIPVTSKPAWLLMYTFRVDCLRKGIVSCIRLLRLSSRLGLSLCCFLRRLPTWSQCFKQDGCWQWQLGTSSCSSWQEPASSVNRYGRKRRASYSWVVIMMTLPSHLHIHGHLSEWLNKTARPAKQGSYQMVLWSSICWFFLFPLGVLQLRAHNPNNRVGLISISRNVVYQQRNDLS